MVWTAGLALALRVLFDLGSGSLGVPLTSIDAFARWVDESAPETMALALLRLAALAGTSYLAACTVLLLVVAVAGHPGLAIGIARLSPAIVRRLVAGSTGIGLAAGTLLAAVSPTLAAAPVAAVAAPAPDDIPTTATATMRRVDPPPRREPIGRSDATNAATATMTRLEPAVATATMTRLPPAATAATKPEPPDPPPAPAIAATSPKPAAVGTGSGAPDPANHATWVVAPGDSFWSIATETLATPGHPPPRDRAVNRYWRRLIAANHERLLDVDNPDLLVPGQELVLPDPA